jgi:glycosyltransferase involved in cell wall biosynthesis
MPEIMVQGETGFMCSTVGDLKQAVRSIETIDPKKCRARVEERFTAGRMGQDYLALYDLTIKDYKGRS